MRAFSPFYSTGTHENRPFGSRTATLLTLALPLEPFSVPEVRRH